MADSNWHKSNRSGREKLAPDGDITGLRDLLQAYVDAVMTLGKDWPRRVTDGATGAPASANHMPRRVGLTIGISASLLSAGQ